MKYGLIGETLCHSFSVQIHALLGLEDYVLHESAPAELSSFLARRDFSGINVTIPYKEAVIPYLDEIDGTARRIGAVNTVVNRNGKLIGYNTDFFGLKSLLIRSGINPSGKTAAILGSGGTSKTARAVLNALGASTVLRVSRTPHGEDEISYDTLYGMADRVSILVNATPVGMFPHQDECPVDLDRFPALCGIADVIYHPLRTTLVLEGKKRGIPSVGGLFMLLAQAAQAQALFFDRPLGTDLEAAYAVLEKSLRNIVLVGMAGCGKTTQGKLLAQSLDLPFYDSDLIFAEQNGCPAGAFIRTYGEEAFRKKESRILAELSNMTGCVIATGGGAVTREDNIRNLRHNGFLLFLNRSPDKLAFGADRPLSETAEAAKRLCRERLPLYLDSADRVIDGNGSKEQVFRLIISALNGQ